MYFPAMINLSYKKVVIIGGGPIAYRKTKTLLNLVPDANVTIVSQEFIPEFSIFSDTLIKDDFKEHYLEGAYLVIAATSDSEINDKISAYCKKNKILLNRVDLHHQSDFIFPSIVGNKGLLITVSTGGKSPALAKKIKEDLCKNYKKYTEDYLNILEDIRRLILVDFPDKKSLLYESLDLEYDELVDLRNKLKMEKR